MYVIHILLDNETLAKHHLIATVLRNYFKNYIRIELFSFDVICMKFKRIVEILTIQQGKEF